MHGFILASTHHSSSVIKIVLGVIVLVVTRGVWVFRRNRRNR